eukprot:scaffold4286_cov92-Amphora_coffeaeformis.AAC.8
MVYIWYNTTLSAQACSPVKEQFPIDGMVWYYYGVYQARSRRLLYYQLPQGKKVTKVTQPEPLPYHLGPISDSADLRFVIMNNMMIKNEFVAGYGMVREQKVSQKQRHFLKPEAIPNH